mmetsp:Transcript_37854/g.55753  ORF Transcript_37854/g.55753 Transcript_37854/m.55753 type:complete len:370 (-) Transcript_37854:438-1547(-)|eukprot:CAMPEP_0195520004 /NCGR_PEP_ID=MMETSP0794_2-20130614/15900_1 /TAXON_ID=515487 /ORGANISM="Stephanopyxis turris, Strain CCMP 815" /LENGTH=369 /DNA_ID=CAMNT_0040649265 /DNA_START=25 /DNA_END=1134 /DNA_ORIENTATION=+
MRRPADQAKLLFLYLLRSSSAAFASESIAGNAPTSTSALNALSSSSHNTVRPLSTCLDGHINLRLARRADITSIQRCNLATLPENYNQQFYNNHMRQWPELALVAEHVPASRVSETDNLAKPFPPSIIGYVLGKVDDNRRLVFPPNNSGITPGTEQAPNQMEKVVQSELLGHVTSLAVLDNYRRRGIANVLMDQLHYHLRECYQADAVGLHVRVSNTAASKLYRDGMGYDVEEIIREYYQDGEDAYLMRKDLHAAYEASSEQRQEFNREQQQERRRSLLRGSVRFGFGLGPKKSLADRESIVPWGRQNEMRLPRMIVDLNQDPSQDQSTSKVQENGSSSLADLEAASVSSATESMDEGLVSFSRGYVSQ